MDNIRSEYIQEAAQAEQFGHERQGWDGLDLCRLETVETLDK